MNPRALETRPRVHQWMEEYITAFNVLNDTRTAGMAPNPISLSEILAYLKLYGASDTGEFVAYIMAMDSAFLSAQLKKAEREKANGSGSRT
jgi:hypothetical protein